MVPTCQSICLVKMIPYYVLYAETKIASAYSKHQHVPTNRMCVIYMDVDDGSFLSNELSSEALLLDDSLKIWTVSVSLDTHSNVLTRLKDME